MRNVNHDYSSMNFFFVEIMYCVCNSAGTASATAGGKQGAGTLYRESAEAGMNK